MVDDDRKRTMVWPANHTHNDPNTGYVKVWKSVLMSPLPKGYQSSSRHNHCSINLEGRGGAEGRKWVHGSGWGGKGWWGRDVERRERAWWRRRQCNGG